MELTYISLLGIRYLLCAACSSLVQQTLTQTPPPVRPADRVASTFPIHPCYSAPSLHHPIPILPAPNPDQDKGSSFDLWDAPAARVVRPFNNILNMCRFVLVVPVKAFQASFPVSRIVPSPACHRACHGRLASWYPIAIFEKIYKAP